jgi:hypothetical protein
MSSQEQNSRLTAAYRKLPPGGRDALDCIVNKLVEVHRDIIRKAPQKASKERKN